MSPAELETFEENLQQARNLRSQGQTSEARSEVKRLIRALDPSVSAAARLLYGAMWYELGLCQHDCRNFDNALECYRRAAEAAPDNVEASYRIVEAMIDSKHAYDHDLVPHYLRYVDAGPQEEIRYGTLRHLQHILRIKLIDRTAVIAWRMERLAELTQIAPELNFPKLYLGRGCYLREDYDDAIAWLTTLNDRLGDSHNVLNMLARSYEKTSELNQAKTFYEKSLRVTPGQAGVHFRLGRIDLKMAEII